MQSWFCECIKSKASTELLESWQRRFSSTLLAVLKMHLLLALLAGTLSTPIAMRESKGSWACIEESNQNFVTSNIWLAVNFFAERVGLVIS